MKNQIINNCNYCISLISGSPCMPFAAHKVPKQVDSIYLNTYNQYFISINERNDLKIYPVNHELLPCSVVAAPFVCFVVLY